MPDKDIAEMVKISIKQSKAMIEIIKIQSDKMKFQVLPTWLKDHLKYRNKVQK